MVRLNQTASPSDDKELKELIKTANINKQKVLLKENLLLAPLAPGKDSLILDLSNFNQVIELDRENATVIVEAGINFLELQNRLKKEGFFIPLDTFASHITSLSFNVTHGLPSYYQGKYGNYREYVTGMEATLYDGTNIKLGGKNIKNVSGFDIMGLLIGSKEALGIITKLILRLLPVPEAKQVLLTPFDNMASAIKAATKLTISGSMPAKLYVLNNLLAEKISAKFNKPIILVEFDGFKDSLPGQKAFYQKIVAEYSKHKSVELVEPIDINKCWQELRETTVQALANTPYIFNFSSDITELAKLVEQLEKLITKNRRNIGFEINGSVGTGTIFPLANCDSGDYSWHSQADSLVNQFNGNVLNQQSFSNSGLELIHQRILKIFDSNNSSLITHLAKGGGQQ